MRNFRKLLPVAIRALAISLFFCAGPAFALPLYSGSISGVFTNPVLTGFNSDLGVLVPVDNTNWIINYPAADYPNGIYEGFGSKSIIWGIGDPPRNQLTFEGADFSNVQPNVVFKLGTIIYTNGSAYVDSTISGATLTLTVNGATVNPAVDQMGVIATINYGIDARADADLLTFQAFSQTFNVFETQTAVADVFGMIVGDPQLVLTGIELAPNQTGNGFIGNGVFLTPEPATYTLLLAGLGLLAFIARRRKHNAP